MSDKTKIKWADSTLNFWEGCTKVSDGCKNCYAEARDKRFTGGKLWGKGAARRKSESAFRLAMDYNFRPWICDECGDAFAEAETRKTHAIEGATHCCSGKYHRRRIFSLSLGDIGDPEIPLELFNEAMVTIDKCREVIWILCTKRAADERIPLLLKIPAAFRGLSLEPLLEPVKIASAVRLAGFDKGCNGDRKPHEGSLEWLIIGWEAGPKRRDCDGSWIRSLVEQGKSAGVKVFVKQILVEGKVSHDAGQWPEWAQFQEWPI